MNTAAELLNFFSWSCKLHCHKKEDFLILLAEAASASINTSSTPTASYHGPSRYGKIYESIDANSSTGC